MGATAADTSEHNYPSPTQWVMHVVESKGLAAAAVGGLGAMYLMNQPMTESVQFGSIVALGCSVGDSALTGFGIQSKIQSYLVNSPTVAKYVDPMDFLGGFVGTMAISYLAGIAQGRDLMMFGALGGVGCGVAPKIVGYIQDNYGKGSDKSEQVSV